MSTESLARVIALTELMWDDREQAQRFLAQPHPELGGRAPIDMARTDLGARQVEGIGDRYRFSRCRRHLTRPGSPMNGDARRYLLDTNILTDLIKNPLGRVTQHIIEVGESNLCTSIVVACELRFGARNKNAPILTSRIERLLQTFEVLPFDGDVDRVYADIRAIAEEAGRPCGANDLLIAAHAIHEDCTLVTHNEAEFRQITGLSVENWLAL